MNTVQAKIPRWIGAAYAVPSASWSEEALGAKPAPEVAVKGFQLTADESARFLRIVSECGRIRRH